MNSFRARSARFDLKINGQIKFNDQVIDCEVMDVSHSGARLLVSSGTGIPGTFDLNIDSARQTFCCSLIWQKSHSVGVHFIKITDK